MSKDWTYLTRITENKSITVTKVKIADNIAIEGEFELPPLAQLNQDDQVFIAVFVKSHGSIKEMEKYFGISYPTVKSRLNRIGSKLDFVEVETTVVKDDVLEKLERGEISVTDAIELLKKGENHG